MSPSDWSFRPPTFSINDWSSIYYPYDGYHWHLFKDRLDDRL